MFDAAELQSAYCAGLQVFFYFVDFNDKILLAGIAACSITFGHFLFSPLL
jgi:hypothetical protein